LTLDAAGNAIAVGELSGRTSKGFAVIKLSGVDGTELWRARINGWSGFSVALDPEEHVVGGGSGFRVAKRSPLFTPVGGDRLRVIDKKGAPSGRRLRFVSTDSGIDTPAAGSAGDPTVGGAMLRLVNPITSQEDSFTLPASGWRARGKPPGSSGYKYFDLRRANGPCTRVILQPERRFKAKCSGSQIAFGLAEPVQSVLTVTLKPGSGPVYCATFGGTVTGDFGVGTGAGKLGIFKAEDAPAPVRCPLPE
jgi:hypothetical protein